jgi:hypothetical protein
MARPAYHPSTSERVMIEIIKGLPDNVVGIVVKGRLTSQDCTSLLIPAIERALDWHHQLRLYYEIRSRYPGAVWDDINLGGRALGRDFEWERIALVSDIAWVRHMTRALRLVIPGEIRLFSSEEVPEGLAWIADRPRFDRQTRVAVRPRAARPARQFLYQEA